MFTQRLVADLIKMPRPEDWELALVDIDAYTLESVELLVKKMLATGGADIKVTVSTDRRDVLPGADVVVSTIAVGGRRGWETDVVVPRKYGIYQPVGDTVMPGGISRAMRMIPAMVAMAEDVKALCPRAHFFNYANPMTANCRAIHKATGVPVIGLCHGLGYVEGQIASFLEVPRQDVRSIGVGLNHLTFITDLFYQGQNAWPMARAKLAEQRPDLERELAEKTEFPNGVSGRPERYSDQPFAWNFFLQRGVFPCAMDRHATEFFPERFPGGQYYGKTLGVDAFPIDKRIAYGDEQYVQMDEFARSDAPLTTEDLAQVPGEHEDLLDIIDSLYGDGRRVFSVNMVNGGAVPNLPDWAVLELPAAATGRGFIPLSLGPLREDLAAIIRRKLDSIEITVDAALSGDEGLFVEALLADGAVTERSMARDLAAELIQAHKEHLPQFA
ncbi:Alpha-galactosidase [Deinococcus marmoris]|uniref:Alpha-galactosidase n=1 Tax=Deinococcus marmoris TaxID=249408 RepID=A0A1U7NR45_9DEIO|nr:Alpha-galactosidase [Deinococcus marmoris]